MRLWFIISVTGFILINSGVSLSLSPSIPFAPCIVLARWVYTDMHYSSVSFLSLQSWALSRPELESINQSPTLTTIGYVDWMSQDIHANKTKSVVGHPKHTEIVLFCTSNSWSSLIFYTLTNEIPRPPVSEKTRLLFTVTTWIWSKCSVRHIQ